LSSTASSLYRSKWQTHPIGRKTNFGENDNTSLRTKNIGQNTPHMSVGVDLYRKLDD